MALEANEAELLRAIVDRIIPRDADPGALDLGTDRFVLALLATSPDEEALIDAGLRALPAGDLDSALIAVESEPWFRLLVTITSEGFYADPDNGGNDGARSWTMIGYRHGLPEGPSGPGIK